MNASTSSTKADDRQQIEATIAQFIAAFHEGDLDALLATYTDDLIKARAGQPDERKQETASRLRRLFEDYNRRLVVRNDELVVSGDLGYVRGVLELTLSPKDGAPGRQVRRRFLEIWRKVNDEWRVCRTMDNSDSVG